MHTDPLPFKKILFVCINSRNEGEICCAQRESEAIAASLKARIKELKMSRHVRVSKSGCQDVCVKGPNVMVFPDTIWYHGVTLNDVEQIIQTTIQGIIPEQSSSCSSV